MEPADSSHPTRERLANCKKFVNYPLILLLCRIILSISQLSVALYVWSIFRTLSRLESGGKYDLDLATVTESNVDVTWVPTIERDDTKSELYGMNKYFNLFMIRLLHYFHGKVLDFLLCPSIIVFILMTIQSISDIIQWYKSRLGRSHLSKSNIKFRSILYFGASVAIILQYIFVIFYSENICRTEMLYPFLFWKKNGTLTRSELLATGSCKLGKRLILSIILTSLSLVPDTFLLILGVLPTFRTFAIIHGLKFFGSIIILGFIIITFNLKKYINIAQNPNILDNSENVINNVSKDGIKTLYKQLRYKYNLSPINNYSDMINYRVSKTVTRLSSPTGIDDKVLSLFKLSETDFDANMHLSYFIFTRNIHKQTLQTIKSFIYSGLYVVVVSFVDAVVGLLLLIKQQRFLVPVLGFVNFVSWIAQIFHTIMVQFPIYNSRFFCEIKEYTPTTRHISFETVTICNWICEMITLFQTYRGVAIVLASLSFISMINLGILYK
ncbi:hypothetical protein BEWA_005220 [Theileria equi strain WA]|uniref:Uncharacterized protein n=1 Tax=Theileria equi strain WA TaxID=1537102 RepID=L0B1V7_THEEQ|nr:hypothetical protein BEWA_005220 [Theileria equi strain WA]AFZ81114.1 hypothetical protein BEWA_005220 [Theileria equi strain WA]|eukprot:XP_004830780.1 hypothetical protein BEWA_005220 [Theileria equi strain WA]